LTAMEDAEDVFMAATRSRTLIEQGW